MCPHFLAYVLTDPSYSVLVPPSCPTLYNAMDCSPPGSSVHGILQARILEWVAIPFSRGSSWPRDWTRVSCIAGGFFTVWAPREASYHQSSLLLLSPSHWWLAKQVFFLMWQVFIHVLANFWDKAFKCIWRWKWKYLFESGRQGIHIVNNNLHSDLFSGEVFEVNIAD